MTADRNGGARMASTSELEEQTVLARRLMVALATPSVMLVAMGLFLGRQLLQMAEDSEWVDHTDQVISTAYETKLKIIDQETGVRGYIVNGESVFLEPFERARPLEGFDRLNALVADNPSQQTRFADARRRYERWLARRVAHRRGSRLVDGTHAREHARSQGPDGWCSRGDAGRDRR